MRDGGLADGSTQGRQVPGEDEAARLEAALERIARAAARPAHDPHEEASRAARLAVVAGHLDTLIAELREVLGEGAAGEDAAAVVDSGAVHDAVAPAGPGHDPAAPN